MKGMHIASDSKVDHQKLRHRGPRRRLVADPHRAVQCRRFHKKQAIREQPLRNKAVMVLAHCQNVGGSLGRLNKYEEVFVGSEL